MPSDLLSFDLEPADGGGAAVRVAVGPGFWTEWLSELSRTGLLEALLADGTVDRALREAPAGHRYDRALNAKMTLICVLVACLFPGESYDKVLALAFGLPGPRFRPPGEKAPTGSAFSRARKLLGEHVMRRAFEIDAETSDADLGIAVLWKGLEVTAIDGTTMELQREAVLQEEFGSSSEAGRPLLRVTAHVRTASRRWIGAAVGTYRQGENELADQLEGSFAKGILNIADRGFFSMDRFLRFSAKGAGLAWRVKNSASQVPFKTVEVLPDGSELVRLRESDGMRRRRRRETGSPQAERLPDTIARLVTFTVLAETRSGRKKKPAQIRVLTTLLDHEAYPAKDIAELYAERWQIEIASATVLKHSRMLPPDASRSLRACPASSCRAFSARASRRCPSVRRRSAARSALRARSARSRCAARALRPARRTRLLSRASAARTVSSASAITAVAAPDTGTGM